MNTPMTVLLNKRTINSHSSSVDNAMPVAMRQIGAVRYATGRGLMAQPPG